MGYLSVTIPKGNPSLFAIKDPMSLSTISRAASLAFAFKSTETMVRIICRTVISELTTNPTAPLTVRNQLKAYRETQLDHEMYARGTLSRSRLFLGVMALLR